MSILRSIILLIVTVVTTKVLVGASVAKAFEDNCIVSDVLSTSPDTMAKVTYPNFEVNLGNQPALTDVALMPEVTYEAEPSQYYTLLMIDPDVPARSAPALREFVHWIVVNIPGNDVKSGNTLAVYLSPTTPPLSGPHRYIFLVYKQCSYIDTDVVDVAIKSTAGRVRFSAEDFAKEHNLGNPIAGNFLIIEIGLEKDTNSILGNIL